MSLTTWTVRGDNNPTSQITYDNAMSDDLHKKIPKLKSELF